MLFKTSSARGYYALRSSNCESALGLTHSDLQTQAVSLSQLLHHRYLCSLATEATRILFSLRLPLLFHLLLMGMFLLPCFTGLVLSSQIKIITPSVNNTLHLVCFHLNSSKSSANMTSFILPCPRSPALLPLPVIRLQPDSQKPKY